MGDDGEAKVGIASITTPNHAELHVRAAMTTIEAAVVEEGTIQSCVEGAGDGQLAIDVTFPLGTTKICQIEREPLEFTSQVGGLLPFRQAEAATARPFYRACQFWSVW